MTVARSANRRLPIYRLVLWNIDLTLVDVARVSRQAYAEAFQRVTGRPLVAVPQTAGRTDSEIFFEALAVNDVSSGGVPDPADPGSQELLGRYTRELAIAFGSRLDQLPTQGRAQQREAPGPVGGGEGHEVRIAKQLGGSEIVDQNDSTIAHWRWDSRSGAIACAPTSTAARSGRDRVLLYFFDLHTGWLREQISFKGHLVVPE